ncbi:unnamed protein product [Trichogramma brassicae]|uniref:DUF5641 domain-containing protein n=1 Tax=Trichogramma brassicae TaxID=86971 RepID=A0A6H5J6K6_9HYME|nr:unnamed protein product [Trichogramma brassicae]
MRRPSREQRGSFVSCFQRARISPSSRAILCRKGARCGNLFPHGRHTSAVCGRPPVRSFKHHFRRVIGDARLTFEELSTVAARIEACLNSRPLCPRSSRPEDFEALTPAHFLVGTSLLDYPEPCDNRTLSFTNRWRLLRGMRDMFWSRWRQEVLSQMQQRSEWLTARESLQPGDMVLLRDDLCTPSSWPLARVVQVHPGSDGLVRVATIKTASSTFTRPIVKLIKLPTDGDAEEYHCRLKEKEKTE